ncbi:hypothetical protein K1719_017982 [Acacia pycnantha]|nr:hypothetical protein K1719_017982 [Acacia pycnantha]
MASDQERERGRGSRTETGGKEGSGGGDGDGASKKKPSQSALGGDGQGFAFGKMAKERRSGEGSSEGATPNLRTNASKLSYRDKLLSPGYAGFLVKHSEEDDIMQGWLDYFHKMNEKEPQDEYSAWCLPWMNSLIIKVLGASFPTYVIQDRINRMWRPRDALKRIPLSNGYYIVSFSNKEDREYAFQEGPWMIEDHYLIVQRWRPNFNPWKADLQCIIAAWVRLPDVPFEFYNVESLRRLGNMIGKMIKVDHSTSIYDKGGFARICVKIDLKKPLLPTYMVFGEERSIVYEGLHNVCFTCGKYGHQKNECPSTKAAGGSQNHEPESTENMMGEEGDKSTGTNLGAGAGGVGEGHTAKDKGVEVGSIKKHRKNKVTGGGGPVATDGEENDRSPFGKLLVLRLDFCGHLIQSSIRKGFNEDQSQTVTQRRHEDLHDFRMMSGKKEKIPVLKENKDDLIVVNRPVEIRDLETQNNFAISPTFVGPKADNGMDIPLEKGTGAKSFLSLVRDLKSHYRLDFLAILETRCSREVSQGRAQKLGFPNSSKSIVRDIVEVTGSTGCSWTLTVVYASPACASRRVLWDNLSRLAPSIQGPWLLGGDFNGTLLHCERRSSATFRSSVDRDFIRWVEEQDMRDVGFVGPEFTWKRGSSEARLDRMLANEQWTNLLPNASVAHLPFFKSDHRPLLLCLDKEEISVPVNRPFRFIAAWVLHDQFDEFVRQAWSPHMAWVQNSDQFTTACSKWNREVFRHTEGRKKLLLRRLDGINRVVSRVGMQPKYETLQLEIW